MASKPQNAQEPVFGSAHGLAPRTRSKLFLRANPRKTPARNKKTQSKGIHMSASISITFFVHGTTVDNENEVSSGWHDAELSLLGIKQSIELRKQIASQHFDAVFCSDLQRALDSANL